MTNMTPPEPVELLAPAGDWDCVRAAIENGANAVYFGLNCGFNARARAANFDLGDLPRLLETLHHRGLRGYVTLNTLAFSDELDPLEDVVRQVAHAGVDAVLVQDLGVVRLIRAVCPDLPIHASTQMTLTSTECIAVAAELGIDRVVLPRELSLKQIARIRQTSPVELEAFVHGALCVAYSGQCLTSESLGGRSANRGQCAQACRLPYDLICDGEDVDLGPQKYLLSPQDLAAYDLTADLIDAGVRSFKIEGRLKTPEYVANITRHYRRALDAVLTGRRAEFTPNEVREMELSFSRGFSPGWLLGDDHKRLVPGLSSSKRGVLLGAISRIRGSHIEIRLQGPVARGDGVVFDGDRAANAEQGGRIYGIHQRGRSVESADQGLVEIEFQHGLIDASRLTVGQRLWKTDDPRLTQRLRQTYQGAGPLRKRQIDMRVRAWAGQPLELHAWFPDRAEPESATVSPEASVQVVSTEPLAVATRHPLTREFLQEQLSRLGKTVYELGNVQAEIHGSPMVPLSVLSKLRQELIARLDQITRTLPPRSIAPAGVTARLRSTVALAKDAPASPTPTVSRLHVLCRTREQLAEVCQSEPVAGELLYADFQDIREYRDAVHMARDAGHCLYLATPRIQKPEELGLFTAIGKHGAEGILVRNLAGLRHFTRQGTPVIADYSLNATNELTAESLRDQQAGRVTASYDLNRDQLLQLVRSVPSAWLEVVIHQHMPMFHMEHCVFCAVLSPGTNASNCGRPCDTHVVHLRDRVGSEHVLQADVGCRNTLFNAVPQSGAEVVSSLQGSGVRDFRVELLQERGAGARRVVNLYRELLGGKIPASRVWQELNAANRVGVTRGTLEARRDPLAIL